jgi:hypothetical protein
MADFAVQHANGTETFNGDNDRYEVSDGVVKVYALSRPKPVLIILPLHQI